MASGAAAQTVSSRACLRAGETMTENANVRVFMRRRVLPPASNGAPQSADTYYACDKALRRRHVLLAAVSRDPVVPGILRPTLNGHYLAYQRGRLYSDCTGRVIVFDVRRGRVIRRSSVTECAAALVVSASGFAAWAYAHGYQDPVVAALDNRGQHELDRSIEAPHIEADSLAFSGNRVSWRRGNRTLSALLR